jgi:ankyrin repeat protein
MSLKNKALLCSLIVLMPAFASIAAAGSIHDAVLHGDLENVKTLITGDSELLNAQDDNGKTALHHAIELDNNRIAIYLIEQGADINMKGEDQYSPLHYAAAIGNLEMARLLLDRGTTTLGDVSLAKHDGFEGNWTPLHLACLNGHEDMVRLLLDHGADIEARDGVQRTPLILSVESFDLEVAKTLVECGADINAQAMRGYTALLWAARNGFKDLVNFLIDKRASIDDDKLDMAFQFAVLNGLFRLYEYVQEKGFNIAEVKERDPGLIFPVCAGGSVEIVRLLVEQGFNLDQTESDGWTPLHYAASQGRVEVMKYLIDNGVNLNARNAKGESAYNLAQMRDYSEAADYLKSAGADISQPQFPILAGAYMGQKPPGDTPEMFLPGIVSGRDRAHSSIIFSPDGKEAYWTEMISPGGGRVAFMEMVENTWSYPATASIDRDPTFSPDGQRLYFIKTRPLRKGEKPGGDLNLKEEYWYLERTASGWSEPISTGDAVNAIGVHWPCSLDKHGNLYFSEFSENMYFSEYKDGHYLKPIRLNEKFGNETLIGRCPFISPDGDYLLFSTNEGMHISLKKPDATWTDKISLGDQINSSHENGCPRVTPDGKYMFFVSAGQGRPWGIYWVSTDFIEKLRAEHLTDE